MYLSQTVFPRCRCVATEDCFHISSRSSIAHFSEKATQAHWLSILQKETELTGLWCNLRVEIVSHGEVCTKVDRLRFQINHRQI